MNSKLIEYFNQLPEDTIITVGTAMPVIYRAVKEHGYNIDVLQLIERLKLFEGRQGVIEKSHIKGIIKQLLRNYKIKDET
jgi:hypothetical protein